MTNKTTGKSRSALLLALFAAACAFLAGCGGAPDDSRAQRYELKGKIVSFNKAQQQVVIQHEEVPGFMDAMTMPFTLREDSAFDVMRAGDRIQATLVVDDERTRLENPTITQATPTVAATGTPTDAPTEPEIGATVPDAALVNQDGKSIKLQQYRGHALVLTFIYTRCPLPDYCTLMSNNFAEIKRELDKSPELRGGGAHLLSITLDPAYDTPQVLRSYGAAHTENYQGEKFENWELATGKPAEIRRVANFFGLLYAQQGEEINHSLRTAVIAPDGKLYKLYRGNEWKPAEILNDLRTLNGAHQPS
ncbi:MAG TPA: SCO family protein [Pyrinomonadaceae bacterium]|jgi:protein SCO1/2|nr:SCO family protein [Pyrinomonadaceae bacterium]